MVTLLFFVLAVVAVASAILVIVHRHPVYSALFLIVTLFCLAGLFVLLNAQFIAAIQVIVYAGAIMVLFLFVIMLLNLKKEALAQNPFGAQKLAGLIVGGVLLVEVVQLAGVSAVTGRRGSFTPEMLAKMGNTETVARLLFTKYLFPFVVASVLLFAAIVGAILLAKKRLT